MSTITEKDALTAVSKRIPQEGITLREFITRGVRLTGKPDDVIEKTLNLLIQDGYSPDDIVKAGPNSVGMH